MSDRSDDIEHLQKQMQELRVRKAHLDAGAESLERQLAETVEAMKALNITPENAAEKIPQLEAKRDEMISKAMADIEKAMPSEV